MGGKSGNIKEAEVRPAIPTSVGVTGGLVAAEGMHPFIQGLLQKLPPPETDWNIDSRAKWLMTAANIFDLIYKSDETKIISVKVENL